MIPSPNIALDDANVIFNLIEQLALILAVLLVVNLLLSKKNLIPKQFKNIVLVLVAFWTLAVFFQTVISTYNYFNYIRPLQRQQQSANQDLGS